MNILACFLMTGLMLALVLMPLGCAEGSDGAASDAGGDGDADSDGDGDADTDNLVCPESANCTQAFCEQVLIVGGDRTMGSEDPPEGELDDYFGQGDERPPHPVRLDPFCIDKYEVTYERYLACVEAGVCDPNGHIWDDTYVVEGYPVVVNHYPSACEGSEQAVALCIHHPVNCRNQAQSEAYCNWVGRTLCTEARWERAANGPGPTIKYPWGDAEPTFETANLPPWSDRITANVDDFPDDVSPEGVLGLGGNVVEWISNWYGEYEPNPDDSPLVNPEGPESGRYASARGGCYFEGIFSNVHRHTFHPEFDWG